MSDCPVVLPQCAAAHVWNLGAATADAAETVASPAGWAVDHSRQILAGGGILIAFLILWAIWRMLSGGARVVKVAVPAAVKGYTGVDVSELKRSPAKTAETKAKEVRVRRETRRGPQKVTHTGQHPEIIARTNDSQGRPTRVVVCAASSLDAEYTLSRRMSGRRWSYAGSKPCDLSQAQNHHTYRAKAKKK